MPPTFSSPKVHSFIIYFSACPTRSVIVQNPIQTPSPSLAINQNGQLSRVHLRYRTRQGKSPLQIHFLTTRLTFAPGQLLLLLQDRRLSSRRSLFAKTCQAQLQSNHPPTQPLPEPCLRPQEQDESLTTPESFRCLLRGLLVRNVQVRRNRRGRRLRQQQ